MPADFVRNFLFASLKEGLANKVRNILFISANLYLGAVIIFGPAHEYTIPSAIMAFVVDILLAVSFFIKDKNKSQLINLLVINLIVFFVLISFGITVPLVSLLLVIDIVLFNQDRKKRLLIVVITASILILETDIFKSVPLPIYLGDVPKIDIVNVVLYIALLLVILSLIELLGSLYETGNTYSNLQKIQDSHLLNTNIRTMLMVDGLNYRLSMHTLKNLLLGLDLDPRLRDFMNIVFFTAIDSRDSRLSGGLLIRGIVATIMYIEDRYKGIKVSIRGIQTLRDFDQKLSVTEVNLFVSTFFNLVKNAAVYLDIHKDVLKRNGKKLVINSSVAVIDRSKLKVVVSNILLDEDFNLDAIMEKSSQKMSGLFLTSIILKDMRKGSLKFKVVNKHLLVEFLQIIG